MSTSISLQPSSDSPPKSSAVRFWSCIQVPNAPSNTKTRSRNALRKSDIVDQATGEWRWHFPRKDLVTVEAMGSSYLYTRAYEGVYENG